MRRAAAAVALAAALFAAGANADEIAVKIPTRPGVTETFLYERPAQAHAGAILLPGGDGLIGIHDQDGKPALDQDRNFLVRTRHLFALQGIAVATLDAPSDRSSGIEGAFRTGAANAQDIGAVVSWLKRTTAQPVWLVGTSMGTVSAANAAVRLGNDVDGLVLTSSIIASGKNAESSGVGEGVLSFELDRIAVPVLIVAHHDDACPVSPPSGAQRILMRLAESPRTELKLIEGGGTPRSGVCQAMSHHGYIGVEDQAVAAIAAFLVKP